MSTLFSLFFLFNFLCVSELYRYVCTFTVFTPSWEVQQQQRRQASQDER